MLSRQQKRSKRASGQRTQRASFRLLACAHVRTDGGRERLDRSSGLQVVAPRTHRQLQRFAPACRCPPLSSPFERVASLAIRSLGLDRPHVAACEQCQTSKAVVCRAFGVIGSPSHTPARAANAKPVKPVRCLPCRSLNESTMPLSCSGTLPDAMPFRKMPKEAVQP